MADLSPYPDTSDDSGAGPDRGSPPSTPRWVKVFGIAFLVLVLLIVIMMARGHMMAGGHGLGGHTPPSSVTEEVVQQP